MVIAWSISIALLVILVGVALHTRRLYTRIISAGATRERLMGELAAAQRFSEASTTKFETFLAATADCVLSVDAASWCHLLNAPARELFGEHSSPQTLLSVTQCAELDEVVKHSRSATEAAEPQRGEVVLHAFGGRVMQVLISQSTSHATVSPEHLILLRDITNLRRLETMRRDFVANVSHELRTPLTSVMAMTETLLDGALEDQEVARHFLRTIMRETDRLVRLTADLLDLSRAETRPVSKVETDLAALIRDIVNRLSRQTSKAGLILTIETPDRLMIECDEDEISQVLLNLIENAVKYTPKDGSVNVGARVSGGSVNVEVADTGIGILRQDLPRLFERFYRVDKDRSRQSGGTGLGLSIVKHIIERHEGGLWVRSEYNHGSVFGFSLPQIGYNSSAQAPTVPDSLRADRLEHQNEYVVVTPPAGSEIEIKD